MFSVIISSKYLESFLTSSRSVYCLVNTLKGNISHTEIRGSLLNTVQTKWCRARVPLVVHIKIFNFQTCLPSILAHVLYHTQGFFSTPLFPLAFWTHLTYRPKTKANQKKNCSFLAKSRDTRPSKLLQERHVFASSSHEWKQKAETFRRRFT